MTPLSVVIWLFNSSLLFPRQNFVATVVRYIASESVCLSATLHCVIICFAMDYLCRFHLHYDKSCNVLTFPGCKDEYRSVALLLIRGLPNLFSRNVRKTHEFGKFCNNMTYVYLYALIEILKMNEFFVSILFCS